MTDLHAKSAWADTQPSQWNPLTAEIEVPLHGAPQTLAPPVRPAPAAPAHRLPTRRWLYEGLRAAWFRAPRTGAAQPTPWQLLLLVLLGSLLLLGAARLEVAGPAQFNLRGWLAPLWSSLLLLWVAWWAMSHRAPTGAVPSDGEPAGGLAAWFALSSWAPVLPTLMLYALVAWTVQDPDRWAAEHWQLAFWVGYGLLTLWVLAVMVRLTARFVRSGWRTAAFAGALVGTLVLGIWQVPDQPWEALAMETQTAPDGDEADAAPAPEPVRLVLSQGVFESQQALWQDQVQALQAPREGVVNVYALVFAPYAHEDVFRRESTMVAELLESRFDALGRTVHLLNHAETAETHVWATPRNLQRAVAALGARMERDRDVLVIYMTSHGARDHVLAASHWPLQVAPVTPEQLRAVLDDAGIRNRVIAISACYSGGWIEPLATDTSLVMTAADATHTSYGCGTRSELTFFGRAVFHEQLRQTHSFTQAFEKAVPLIAQREIDAGKPDGFSNPQIHVGPGIQPVLQALQARLEAEQPATAPAKP